MSDWPQKGDYVVATKSGTAIRAQGYGRVSFNAGQELIVTSLTADHVRCRNAGGGPVFNMRRSEIRPVPRMIGEIPDGGIAPEDPRISWLFEDAGRMADRLGLCADYDRLCDALGIPGRMRSFTISVYSADGIEVTAKVDARSRRLAEMKVREQLAPTNTPLVLEASR